MQNEVIAFPQHRSWKKLYFGLLYGVNENGDKCNNFDLNKKFENGVFIYRPYYDGECNCGYEEKKEELYESEHEERCPTRYFYELYDLFLTFGMNSETINILIKREMERMGLKFNTKGSFHYICTCSWKDKIKEWERKNDHLENCSLLLPNFHYKKTDFKIFNSKNCNLGFVMNQQITFKEFQSIIFECYQSLKIRRGEIAWKI